MKYFSGVDIVNVKRIKKASLKESFLKKIFTKKELESINLKSPQTIAGRFAAKEAVMKCIGRGIDFIAFTDIEILNDEYGKPYVTLSKNAKEYADDKKIKEIDVSISHEEEYAVAFAVGR